MENALPSVSATTLRQKLNYYLDLVEQKQQSIMVTKWGKPIAVVIPYPLFLELQAFKQRQVVEN